MNEINFLNFTISMHISDYLGILTMFKGNTDIFFWNGGATIRQKWAQFLSAQHSYSESMKISLKHGHFLTKKCMKINIVKYFKMTVINIYIRSQSMNASWKNKIRTRFYFISRYLSVQANIEFHQSPYTLAPFHNSGYKKWTALLVRHAYKNQVHGQDKNVKFSWTNVYKLNHA